MISYMLLKKEFRKVNQLLDSVLLDESPEIQYDLSQLLLQYGFVEQEPGIKHYTIYSR